MKTFICIFTTFLLHTLIFGQYPNVKVNTRDNAPNEVTIAINPVNPDNLAAGANLSSYYYSTDGGKSWKDSTLSSPLFGVWGDPCVTYDAMGNVYFGHLSVPPDSAFGYWIDRIIVQKSSDGGKTYNGGVGIGYNPPVRQQDKEWLTADNSNSMHKNNLYIAWTEFDKYGSSDPRDSSRIRFSRSTDGGNSWSEPIVISDTSGDCLDSDNTDEGAVPAVGPNGEIYTSWAGPGGIKFDKSTDGGLSFGKDKFVTTQPGGWDFDVPGIFRANGLPVTVCDISNSPYRGTIYINWSDQRYGYTDVFIIKSTDGGNHWSHVKKVNPKSGRDRFFTWATVDQKTGTLWLVYYDRSETTDSAATDVFVSKSTDGGETFSSFKISQSPFIPNRAIFFGDYINIAAYNGKVYPIWMRMDNLVMSIWTAIIDESSMGIKGGFNSREFEYRLEQNYPNPFNPSTHINYSIAHEGFVSLKIYNSLGKIVADAVNKLQDAGEYTINFDGSRLPSGLYFYKLMSAGFSAANKMILLK